MPLHPPVLRPKPSYRRVFFVQIFFQRNFLEPLSLESCQLFSNQGPGHLSFRLFRFPPPGDNQEGTRRGYKIGDALNRPSPEIRGQDLEGIGFLDNVAGPLPIRGRVEEIVDQVSDL